MKHFIITCVLGVTSFGIAAEIKASETSRENTIGGSPAARQDDLYNGWEFIAGSDKKQVTLKLVPKNLYQGLSFTFATPLNESVDYTNLYDSKSNAFANTTSATVNKRFSYDFLTSEKSDASTDALLDACENTPEDFGFKADEKDKCGTQADALVDKLIRNPSPASQSAVNTFKTDSLSPLLFWGATGTIARKEVSYFTDDSVNKEDDTVRPWGLSAYVSLVLPTSMTLTFAIEYQKSFETPETGKQVTRCPIVSEGALSVECATASLGEAEETTNRNIKISVRRPFDLFGLKMAISPQFTFDDEDNARAWEVPLYLFGNGSKGLAGGIRYDYDSSNNDGSVYSLFIGSKFEL